MGKATNFKFGRTIHNVHPNKSPLKILEKSERGHMQGNFLGYPLLSRERVKLQTANFVGTFLGSINTIQYNTNKIKSEQKPIENFGKSSRGRSHAVQ